MMKDIAAFDDMRDGVWRSYGKLAFVCAVPSAPTSVARGRAHGVDATRRGSRLSQEVLRAIDLEEFKSSRRHRRRRDVSVESGIAACGRAWRTSSRSIPSSTSAAREQDGGVDKRRTQSCADSARVAPVSVGRRRQLYRCSCVYAATGFAHAPRRRRRNLYIAEEDLPLFCSSCPRIEDASGRGACLLDAIGRRRKARNSFSTKRDGITCEAYALCGCRRVLARGGCLERRRRRGRFDEARTGGPAALWRFAENAATGETDRRRHALPDSERPARCFSAGLRASPGGRFSPLRHSTGHIRRQRPRQPAPAGRLDFARPASRRPRPDELALWRATKGAGATTV
ncbi:MAG: hypothetical protein ACLT98_08635 [Eggerthellaceae bacterium]